VTFSATVSGGEGPYQVAWDFGDGSAPVTTLETVHTYERAGTYHWIFTAQDALGGLTRCEGDVLVLLPLADATDQVIAAHVTRLPGWTSQIVLTNTGDTPVTPQLYALAADGTHLATATLHELPARAHTDLTPDALFPGIPAATDFWVLVADAPRVEGVTVFGTDDGQSLVTMPLLRGGDTALVFPFVYISDIYYTGLTLVNPGQAAVAARLTALAESGEELAAIDLVIPARGKYVRLLDGIFPGVEPILIRFVAVSAERELVGFELFGSFVDQGLAGLPAVLMTPLTGPPMLRDIPPAADPVTKPTGFQGWGISDTAVRLRWNANVEPGVHYVIYRKNGMYTTEVGQTESTAFTVTGLETGRTYTFLMKAVDGVGTFSAYSRQIRVAPLPSGQMDWPHRLFYGAVPDPARYYTGVTFSVSGTEPVTAHAFIQDADGLVLADAEWPAAPGEQITRELPALFGQTDIPGAACLRVGADVPLTGFSLYMTRPGLAPTVPVRRGARLPVGELRPDFSHDPGRSRLDRCSPPHQSRRTGRRVHRERVRPGWCTDGRPVGAPGGRQSVPFGGGRSVPGRAVHTRLAAGQRRPARHRPIAVRVPRLQPAGRLRGGRHRVVSRATGE